MHFDWFDYTHHKYAQYKQKGFSLVLIIIIVLIALVVLSVPLPGYRSMEVCTESDPPVCLAKGWYLKTPLYQQLFFAGQTAQQSIPPTPLPSVTSAKESDSTANWKTYTNKKDAIMFRYPENWRLTVKENTFTGYDEVTVARVIKVPMPDQPDKTISQVEEEFYVYPVSDNGKPQFTNWQPNIQRSIGGIECKGKESLGSQQQAPNRYYECIVNSINFGITLTSTKSNYSTSDQILSTFQFLNQGNTCTQDSDCPQGLVCVGRGPTQPSKEIPGVCVSQKQ